jgi:hypothetical protein
MAKPNNLEPIVKTTFRIPKSLVNAAKHRAIDDGTDMNTVVVRALEQYLGKKGGKQ